ncbi:MAG: DUF2924 domain-containing protein [Xanthobacteraceae bacterium]
MARASKGEAAGRGDLTGAGQGSRRLPRRSALAHLPKHLQTAVVTYRRQADQFGQLDTAIRQVLDRIAEKETRSSVMAKLVAFDRSQIALKAGTILSREWNGATHRVVVVDGGFLWDGITYDSLSKVAFAITGTRWNGPRFFGLRDATGNGDEP